MRLKMTPEQEAAYALRWNVARSDLPQAAQLAYDRLQEERARSAALPAESRVGAGPASGHVTMPRWLSAVLTTLSVLFGPGTILVLFPWMITKFQVGAPPWPAGVRALGLALIVAGVMVNVATFVRFSVEGVGVPFPTDPPSSQRVMVGGPYRYVRNPMYVSYFAAIIGEALLLSRPVLLIYLLVVAAVVVAFVHWWEEPTMAKRFGAEYDAYRRQVPGWWPRPPRRAATPQA
jgi:protein-S-isoprenylcysteine O-methyltransferase Ste14